MVSFCALSNLSIASMFPHKNIHRYTWTSPNGQHHNQIDHMAVRSNFKRSVQDNRAETQIAKGLQKERYGSGEKFEKG